MLKNKTSKTWKWIKDFVETLKHIIIVLTDWGTFKWIEHQVDEFVKGMTGQ